MNENEGPLAELAEAILDGTFIDWASAESSANEAEKAVMRQLKIVAEIAGLHRRAPSDELTTGSGVAQPFRTLEPLEQWGHLRILEFIGRGSFGEVYRAWNTRLDREVALKLLYPSNLRKDSSDSSVIHEGRLLARVQHPNVATIYDAELLDGRVGFWMEFIHGRTLEQILREGSVFQAGEVIDIGVDLCRALAAVHEAGLLHRDIKTPNVMRAENGRIVLMDFGTGRELGVDAGDTRDVAGTPLYLAPEIFAGQETTVRSDIYSVGVLLYHLLTGSYPILGATVAELRQAHKLAVRTDLRTVCPELSEKLVRVIERALDTDPEWRFENAESMAEALELLKPGAESQQRGRTAWRYGLAIAACAVVAVLLYLAPPGWRARNSDNPDGKKINASLIAGQSEVSAHQIRLENFLVEGAPSPDGRYFSYSERNAGNLVLLDLYSGERRFLTHNRGDGQDTGTAAESIFSADGRQVAYGWDLMDSQCSQVRTVGIEGGEPRVLFGNKELGWFYIYQWSRDGKWILGCLEGKNNDHTIGLLSVEDGSLRLLKSVQEMPFASLSPDGRFITYDRPKEEAIGEHRIHILAADGSQDHPIVEGPWEDSHPIWIPGESSVLFASNRTGSYGLWKVAVSEGRSAGNPEIVKKDMGHFLPKGLTQNGDFYYDVQTGIMDVYLAALDPANGKVLGSPRNPARTFLGSNSSPDWAPDGSSLVYASRREMFGPNARVLVTQSLETGQFREFALPLTDMPAPRWSPDGGSIAFRGRDSHGNTSLQILDFPSGTIVANYRIAADVAWTHDGSRMYFLRIAQGVFKMDVRSQKEVLLCAVPPGSTAWLEGIRLSPDEQWIALSTRGKEDSLLLIPAGGGPPTELFRSTDGLAVAGWLPDGNTLLFTVGHGESEERKTELWGISPKGGAPRSLGLSMASLREVRLSPDGQNIAFTSGTYKWDLWVMKNLLP